MVKWLKRRLSLVLAVLMTIMAVNWPADAFAQDDLFQDNFASNALAGWNQQNVGSVSDGKYTILYDGINTAKGLTSLSNCAVSADVSVSVAQAANGFTVGGTAYIAARSNTDMTQGYEFGIGVSKNGNAYVRLYRRGINESQVLWQKADTVTGVGAIKQNTSYNLKLITAGNRIIGYINDVLVVDLTDNTYTSGGVGVHNVSAKSEYDNFKVQRVPEQAVEKIEVVSHSDTISIVGKLYFTIKVTYNSVYGTEELNQDSAGVSYSGLDGRTGNKTIRVEYRGKTAVFPLKVTEKYQATGLFSDNFSGDLSSYEGGTLKDNEYGYEYKFVIENGMARANVPNMKGADKPLKITANLPAKKTQSFESYTVVADAYIYSDSPTPTKRYGAASIVYAKNSESGQIYDMRVQSNGMIMFYCGSELLYSTSAQAEKLDIAFGKKIAMRAHVYSDYVEFYCDGKKVYTYFEYNREECTPYVGFSAIGGTVAFDRFAGTTLEVKGDYAIKSIELITTSGSVVKEVTSSSLDISNLALKLNYIDGSAGYASIKEHMVSGYNAGSKTNQIVTFTYAGKKVSLKFNYVSYLFYDDFESGVNSKWKFPTSDLMSYQVTNGRLRFEYNSSTSSSGSIHATVQGGEEWTDYVVSADVFFDSRANVNGRDRFAGITARYNGKSWYEFRLVCSAGAISGALYRFDESGTNILQTYRSSALLKCLAENKALSTGVIYNIRMELSGNTIKTYLDDTLIAVCTDDTGKALKAGTAGIRNISTTAYYDNFIVRQRNNTISEIRLGGMKGNVLEQYTGFDIELWKYSLEIVYVDGEVDSVMLRDTMISEYDNTLVGRQKVNLNYLGYSYPLTIEIKERPQYIQSVEKAIEDFKGKDAAKFSELKEKYDALSPYETTKLKKDAIKKYNKIYEQIEREKYDDIADSALLVADDFNNSTEDAWKQSIEGDAGKWFMYNSVFYQAQRAYNRAGNGWRTPDMYGKLTSISADCQMLSNDMYMGIAINVSEDGYYHTRLTNKTRDDKDNVIYTLQLYKKTSEGHKLVNSILTEVNDVKIELGQWFNLRLTVQDNLISVYIDDILMLTYEDSGKILSTGECGMRLSEGDALFDNVRVYGTELERDDTAVKIKPTKYEDDFEDEKVGESPSHWQENYVANQVVDNWKVFKKDSNVYGTQNKKGYTATWLHVFDNNPEFSARFMVESKGSDAQVGFITRRSPDTAYVDIGYDFNTSKWFIKSQESEAAGEVMFWADNTSKLTLGEWYKIKVEESGSKIVISVNDKEVLKADNVKRTGYGRVGAFTNNASMYLDDIKYIFASGDIPLDGLTSYVAVTDEYANYMEIESPDNGKTLVGISASSRWLSTDYGITWKKSSEYNNICNQNGGYSSVVKLKNGKYLQINLSTDAVAEISGNLKDWETAGRIVPEEDQIDVNGHRCVIAHVNTPVEYKLDKGSTRIFCPITFRRYNMSGNSVLGHYTRVYYSDDNGYTWKASENSTKDVLPNYSDEGNTTWAESKIVKCSDGTFRMYYSRNYLGCMQYTVSKDNGVTWEGLYQIPEMQCAMTSFAVAEDPENPGTYYMLWVNGKSNYLGSVYPRNRICLVKSTDGMNWEFVMNCERMSDYISVQNGEELYQILDPSIYVTGDYVYITFGRSEREFAEDDAYSHQAQRCYYIRAEKDKLMTRAWDASTIANMRYPKTIEFEEKPQTKFGMSDLFNAIGTIKLTDFLGKTTIENISDNCTLYKEPNMFQLGLQNVSLYYKNGTELKYQIEVVPNYNIAWNISSGGKVEPYLTRIMEGENQTFDLIPDKGYKVKSVYVNGEKYSTLGKKFTVKDVKENLNIEVIFAEKTILDYLVWIILALIIIGGASGGYVLYRKKRLNKTVKEEEV